MRKNSFFKVAAVVICLAFITVLVPGLNSAEKKIQKFEGKPLLMKPLLLLYSIFPFFNSIFDIGNDEIPLNKVSSGNSTGKVRITGGIPQPKPSGGD